MEINHGTWNNVDAPGGVTVLWFPESQDMRAGKAEGQISGI